MTQLVAQLKPPDTVNTSATAQATAWGRKLTATARTSTIWKRTKPDSYFQTLFTIEPGIYLPEFGVRSEVDVYIHADGKVEVTGGDLQTEVVRILDH